MSFSVTGVSETGSTEMNGVVKKTSIMYTNKEQGIITGKGGTGFLRSKSENTSLHLRARSA